MKFKWAEWKERIFIILAIVVFFLLVVFTIQLYSEITEDMNYEVAKDAYGKGIPNDIASYPDLKKEAESFQTQYDEVSQGSDDYRFDRFLFESRAQVGVIECDIRLSEIKHFKRDGLDSFDQEVDLDHYYEVDRLKGIIGTIPSISVRYQAYASDKKLTYKEYCSLVTMLNLWIKHKDELSKKDLKNNIKNNLS